MQSESDGEGEGSSSAIEDDDRASEHSITQTHHRQLNHVQNGPMSRPSSVPIEHHSNTGRSHPTVPNSTRVVSDSRLSALNTNPGSSQHHGARHSAGSPSQPYGNAKDSFLNYFFGGSANGFGGGVLSQQPHHHQSGRTGRPSMTITRPEHDSSQQVQGLKKSGFEGANAAFNMKSLEKHMLEAVSLGLTPALRDVHGLVSELDLSTLWCRLPKMNNAYNYQTENRGKSI